MVYFMLIFSYLCLAVLRFTADTNILRRRAKYVLEVLFLLSVANYKCWKYNN